MCTMKYKHDDNTSENTQIIRTVAASGVSTLWRMRMCILFLLLMLWFVVCAAWELDVSGPRAAQDHWLWTCTQVEWQCRVSRDAWHTRVRWYVFVSLCVFLSLFLSVSLCVLEFWMGMGSWESHRTHGNITGIEAYVVVVPQGWKNCLEYRQECSCIGLSWCTAACAATSEFIVHFFQMQNLDACPNDWQCSLLPDVTSAPTLTVCLNCLKTYLFFQLFPS